MILYDNTIVLTQHYAPAKTHSSLEHKKWILLGLDSQASNLKHTWEGEAGGSQVQGLLGYLVRYYLKIKRVEGLLA